MSLIVCLCVCVFRVLNRVALYLTPCCLEHLLVLWPKQLWPLWTELRSSSRVMEQTNLWTSILCVCYWPVWNITQLRTFCYIFVFGIYFNNNFILFLQCPQQDFLPRWVERDTLIVSYTVDVQNIDNSFILQRILVGTTLPVNEETITWVYWACAGNEFRRLWFVSVWMFCFVFVLRRPTG